MERFQLLNGETLVASFSHQRTLIGDVYSEIMGLAPIWDNGNSLDYSRPSDFRARFDFASFAPIKYDFIKDCRYTREFQSKAGKLLVLIRSGELTDSIYAETRFHYPDEGLTHKTVDFIKERCEEFLKPLK